MCRRQLNPLVPILFSALFILFLISIGAIVRQQQFLERGIPPILPEPIHSGGAKLGFNVNLEQYSENELDSTLDEIKETGVGAVKQSFYFDQEFDWTESDRLIEAVRLSGLTLVALLDGDPQNDYAPVEDPSLFAEWAGEFAGRYGKHIDYYLIWDEPNLTSHWGNQPVNPEEYAAILTSAAQAIRSADPEAKIVAAPLAPTVEKGPTNLAARDYLQALYETGISDAFDIVAGKPYGFNSGPSERLVDPETLNFSHIILMREVMEANGDGDKAIWAGNWGWNSLPPDWTGSPSIWGQVTEETQAEWIIEGFERARQEWPWMGYMFLETWQPDADQDDPRWGFSLAGRPVAQLLTTMNNAEQVAYPGFHLASDEDLNQKYSGKWRFSPDFGADVGESGDSIKFQFWGTDIGLRVRRANYHARFYVTVDGQPANQLPKDDQGSTLVLNSPDPTKDYIANELIASNLIPGEHTLEIISQRGSDQWALNGFSVGYMPSITVFRIAYFVLGILAAVSLWLLICTGRNAKWGEFGRKLSKRYDKIGYRAQILATSGAGLIVVVTGWLTWGENSFGIYRRLGDATQIALTGIAASIFYIAPSFLAYIIAAAILFVLVFLRPVWGLALVAFTIPFYVKPKPMLGYLFSPVEIFLLVTLAAYTLRTLLQKLSSSVDNKLKIVPQFNTADWAVFFFTLVATVSLIFTERLDVASNEWRVLIVEPAIFYFLFRFIKPSQQETWTVLDAFVLGGVLVALIGLWQYVSGQNLITSEGGLMRLRSIYGSPNNVALYLGRIIPILAAMVLMGIGKRRSTYFLFLIPVALAMMLSFSKGALFLGLPSSLLVVLILWRRFVGGSIWPWLIGAGVIGLIVLFIAIQIPQLSGRLNPQGATGFFRMNLWLSTVNMIKDHPFFGVGLDNFLYEYRGRYIFDAAWQEPNLSHPHNIFLDFASRLGIFGFVAGLWLFASFLRINIKLISCVEESWFPVVAGSLGSIVYILAHGLVDHSYFLVDLAYAFLLILAINVWLIQARNIID